MNTAILNILACPICKGKLHYLRETQEFICVNDRLLFVSKDKIPVLMEEQAIELTSEEMDNKLKKAKN